MASQDAVTMAEIIDRAVKHYYRAHIFAEAARAWNTDGNVLMAEYYDLEGTIADGLSDNEW